MKLDNRNKDVANDPEIKEILDQDPPATNEEPEPSEEIQEDMIEETEEVAEEEVDDTTDDTTDDDDDSTSDDDDEAEEEESVPEPTKKKAPTPTVEERYKESSKEAMVLFSKNKKLTDTIEQASNLPEPTLDELKAYAREKGANYDELDEFTQGVMKDTYISKKQFGMLKEVQREAKELDEWVSQVDSYIDSPDVVNNFPAITENAEEFRSYALKASRRGADMEMLSASFLYSLANQPKAKKKKGSLLLSGGNSRAEPVKPKGLSVEELAHIRRTDPKKYRSLIKSGQANVDV